MSNGRLLELKQNFKKKKLPRENQEPNCQDRFSTRTLSYLEEDNPSIFKMTFLKNRPIHFHITKTKIIWTIKQTKLSFPGIESN